MTAETLAEPRTKAGRKTAPGKRTESHGNVHRVNAAQWSEWGPTARFVFNDLYFRMKERQRGFIHPLQPIVAHKHWLTVAWNAAWHAAEAAQHIDAKAAKERAAWMSMAPGTATAPFEGHP